jgi:hypothetical protein
MLHVGFGRLTTKTGDEKLFSDFLILKKDLPAFQAEVKEFQEMIYENPEFTEKQREELEKEFNEVIWKKYAVKE